MKKRQILAALLAVSCASSMAVPAFADDTMAAIETAEVTGAGVYELAVAASVQTPTLKVTLPTKTSVLVNPYRIEITVQEEDVTNSIEKKTSFDTVLSPEMEVTNESSCAITVGVKGMLQTYTIVANYDKSAAGVKEYDLSDPETPTQDCTVAGTIDGVSKIYSSDAKNFYTEDGKQVTVKYTKPTYATKATETVAVGDLTKAGSIAVTAYTASKTIKVATAALKDEDAEKGNTLFMYVQGKQDGDSWAAFDAKANAATAAKPAGMMALSAKETSATILYLGGYDGVTATKGQLRVTGQAATNPTQKWSEVTDDFDTIITFVVDPVANAKPAAPVLKTVKITGVAAKEGTAGDAFTVAGAATTGLTWDAGSEGTNGTITATTDMGVLVPDLSSTDTSVISINSGKLKALDNGKSTITMSFNNKGVTSEYTFEITVSGL